MVQSEVAPIPFARSTTRRRLSLALAGLVGGLTGLGFGGTILLLRLAHNTRLITRVASPAIQNLSELRGDDLALRTIGREALAGSPLQWASLEEQFGARRASAGAHVQSYAQAEELVDPQGLSLGDLQRGQAAFVDLIRRSMDSSAEGRPQEAEALIDSAVGEHRAFDAELERLIRRYSEVETESFRVVRYSLQTLATAGMLCLALGVVGALALWRIGIEAVERSEAVLHSQRISADARASELDAFAGRIAHDLRTPLSSISIAMSLASKQPLAPGVLRVVEIGLRSLRRLDEMIEGLLAFARCGANTDRSARCDVDAALRDVTEERQVLAAHSEVSLRIQTRGAPVAAILGTHLREIIGNLIDNSIKYRGDGPSRYVELAAEESGRHIEIRVTDNGVGVAEKTLPRIFDPFFRAREDRLGHGIGLATVKRLVDAYGGTILVSSRPGLGSCFRVLLPKPPLSEDRPSLRSDGRSPIESRSP